MSVTTRPSPWGEASPRTRIAPHRLDGAEAGGAPRRSNRVRTILVALGLAAVVGGFAARCARIAWDDSITSDESTHLIHCLHYWMTGDDLSMWELGAPRLPHALGALASYAALKPAGLLPEAEGAEARIGGLGEVVRSGARRALVPARCVAIGWGVVLLLAVFWAGARTRGAVAGLVASAVVAMVPEVVAHSAIAGSDMPFTASAFLALILMARYAEAPSRGRWVALAVGIGLAWAMRHTALLLLPMAAGVHLVVAWRRDRPRGVGPVVDRLSGSFWAGVGLGVVAYLVLWAGDGFGTVTLAEFSRRVRVVDLPSRVGPVDLSGLPLPTSLLSILKQVRHQNQGHEAYLCGSYGATGWPWYFPIAFALKTPVGLLALLALAAARVRPRGTWEWLVVAFLGVLWLMLVRNKVNIGVRYALLSYPLAATFVSRLFERGMLRDRVWGPLTLAAAAWFVGASAWCGGRCLSYFNEIGGGPSRGWLYLADSNLDWGQDFDALAATVRQLGIDEVTVDVSSARTLSVPGVYAVSNPARAFQVPDETPPGRRLYDSEGSYLPVYTRYVAVSASRLLGLYSQNDMSWLRTRKVVARVRDSIFLFDMDTPADRPFGSDEP